MANIFRLRTEHVRTVTVGARGGLGGGVRVLQALEFALVGVK